MNSNRDLATLCWSAVASDCISLRRAGMPAYGANGAFGEPDLGNAHGANERLPVESCYEGVEFLHRLLKAPAADGSAQDQ